MCKEYGKKSKLNNNSFFRVTRTHLIENTKKKNFLVKPFQISVWYNLGNASLKIGVQQESLQESKHGHTFLVELGQKLVLFFSD